MKPANSGSERTQEHQEAIVSVNALILPGLPVSQIEEGEELVKALVDTWVEQADEDVSLEEIAEAGLAELVDGITGLDAQDRLAYLKGELLTRQVEKLGGRTLRLAVSTGRGELELEDGIVQAKSNHGEVHRLLPEVKALEDEELKKRLLRLLANADLESRFVQAGASGVRSLRLSHRLS